MTLLLTPLGSHDYSGWASYEDFYTTLASTYGPLFNAYYGPATSSDAVQFDTGKVFNGVPGLRMTFRASPDASNGWSSYATPFAVESIYVRDIFELAPTFTPAEVETGTDGLVVAEVIVRDPVYSVYYDYVRLRINNGNVILTYFRGDTSTITDTVTIGTDAVWKGSPKQFLMLIDPLTATDEVRVRVWLGNAADSLDELTLLHDATYETSGVANVLWSFSAASYITTRWDWWFARPTSDDFRMWSYLTEFGRAEEVDGLGQIGIAESVKARTSREVPLLNEVYTRDFSALASLDDFYASPGWLFAIGYYSGLLDTTRPYSGGMNAMRYRLRQSPMTNASITTGGFSGAYANTTDWYVRQVFEWAATFAPVMTLTGDTAGVRMSSIPITVSGSTFDTSHIILNDGELRHVWARHDPVSTTVTVLGDLADWVGTPMQLVHWVQRVSSTTWRIRIWGGAASVGYRDLELLYDGVVTSSFTDAVLYNTTRWGSYDVSEYPTTDDWTLWVYSADAGIPDYFSDPTTSFTETMGEDISVIPNSSAQTLALAVLSNAFEVARTHALSFTANAAAQDRVQLPHTLGVQAAYGSTLQERTALREQQRVSATAALVDAVELLLTFTPTRAVLVSEAMGMLSMLGVNARYTMSVLQLLQVRDTLLRAIGAGAGDLLTAMDLATERAAFRAAPSDGLILTDAGTCTLVLHLTVPDALAVDDTVTLRQLLSAMLDEQVQLLGSMVIPGVSSLTWAVNARTGATTEYTGYDFNSFARRGTRYLAAADDGLYVLDGDLDHGAPIVAELVSGFLQFAGTRFASFKAIYLGMRGNGNVFFRLTTGDDKTYTYRVTAQSMENTKIRVGKGLRARYFAFEMTTVGQDFDLDSIEFLPIGAQRRV